MSTFLQERFIDVLANPQDIAQGKVLQYDSNGDLRCVIPVTGGILAQVVANVDSEALPDGDYVESVTCVGNGVTQTGINQNGEYIFTIPSLGTYTITVISHTSITVTETVNVSAIKQYLVNIWIHPEISSTLDDNSWKVIRSVTRHGVASSYWQLGSTKNITLSAGTIGPNTYSSNNLYHVFIIGFDHNTELETSGKSTITFQMAKYHYSGSASNLEDICMICSGYYSTDTSATDGFFMVPYAFRSEPSHLVWSGSYMRNTLCQQFYNLLPSECKNVILNCSKYSTNRIIGFNTNSPIYEVTLQEETIFILSEKELFGNSTLGYADESSNGKQMQYGYYYDAADGFKNLFKRPIGDSTIGTLIDRSCYYTRSLYINGNSLSYVGVNLVNGSTVERRSLGPGFQAGFTPAFVVG